MTTVAVLSLPLRLNHALAWISQHPGRVVLVVTSAEVVKDSILPAGTVVSVTGAQQPTDASDRLLRSGTARRIVRWVRRGSRIGGRIEQAIRRALVTRFAQPSDGATVHPPAVDSLLLAKLGEIQAADPVAFLAVFDVTDLPTVLAFADNSGAEVAVL
jgi:hypothetical protein